MRLFVFKEESQAVTGVAAKEGGSFWREQLQGSFLSSNRAKLAAALTRCTETHGSGKCTFRFVPSSSLHKFAFYFLFALI